MNTDDDLNSIGLDKNLVEIVRDLRRRIDVLERKPVEVSALDELSGDLGVMESGEFRSHQDPLDPHEPGDGMSGVRIVGGGAEYGGINYAIACILNDELGLGLTLDGMGKFAGGLATIGLDAITIESLNYIIKHIATAGGYTRYGKLMMAVPPGGTKPAWSLDYSDGAGTELITNYGFEDGALTGWTESGTHWSASSEEAVDGTYSAKYDATESGHGDETLTSDRIACTAGTNYKFSMQIKETIDITDITRQISHSAVMASANPNTNYDDSVAVGESTTAAAISRSCLDFDALPSDSLAVVTTAKMYLYNEEDNAALAHIYRLYRLKRNWVYNEVTWNIYSTGNNWATAGGFGADDCEQIIIGYKQLSASESVGWLYISITESYIQEIIRGTWTDYGFLLKSSVEANEGYYTLADVDDIHEPYLTITYQVQPDYKVEVLWYDAGAAGNLLRTDLITEESGSAVWTSYETNLTAPTSALSFEIVITGKAGNSFYVDNISASAIGVNERLWITDRGLRSTHDIYPMRDLMFLDEVDTTVTLTRTIATTQAFNFYWANTAANAANGDEYIFQAALERGFYNMALYGITNTTAGCMDIYIDGTLVWSRIDWYATALTVNQYKYAYALPVLFSGVHEIKLKMNETNTASTDYTMGLTYVMLTRLSVGDSVSIPLLCTSGGTIASLNADTVYNHKTNTTLVLGESNAAVNTVRWLIRFNELSNSPALPLLDVTAATLTITNAADYSDNARTFRIFRPKLAWVAGEVTWNSYSTGNAWNTAGGFGANDCEQTDIGTHAFANNEVNNTSHDFSLTLASIQEYIDADWTDNGILIKADTELNDAYTVHTLSTATPAYRPILTLTATVTDI